VRADKGPAQRSGSAGRRFVVSHATVLSLSVSSCSYLPSFPSGMADFFPRFLIPPSCLLFILPMSIAYLFSLEPYTAPTPPVGFCILIDPCTQKSL